MEVATAKRVSLEQKNMLIQHLEEHRDFAHDRFSNDSGAKSLCEQWEALARKLNAVSGAFKNGEGWKRAWVNMKSKTKQKSQDLKRLLERSGVNGSIPTAKQLTDLDERVIGVMTRVAVFGEEAVAEPLRARGLVQTASICENVIFESLEDDDANIVVSPQETTPNPPRQKRRRVDTLDDRFLLIEERRMIVETENLAINKERRAIEAEILDVNKQRLEIETENLVLNKRRMAMEEKRLTLELQRIN